MTILETERLTIRRLGPQHAEFMLEVLNDAAFLQHIGDRGVRTADDARTYIANGPMASYARFGFGMYLVERRADAVAIGICGLLKRDNLDDVDIGFAFLPAYRACGYASESVRAVIQHGQQDFALKRIIAIASPGNASSIALLEKAGFKFEREVTMTPGDTVSLYGFG